MAVDVPYLDNNTVGMSIIRRTIVETSPKSKNSEESTPSEVLSGMSAYRQSDDYLT
jgi:hypothetical protein